MYLKPDTKTKLGINISYYWIIKQRNVISHVTIIHSKTSQILRNYVFCPFVTITDNWSFDNGQSRFTVFKKTRVE